MNWDQIEGKWDQLKEDVKTKWEKLTDEDLQMVGGKLDKLVGKVCERYGVKKEQAQHQVSEWADRFETRVGNVARSVEKRIEEHKEQKK